MKKVSEIAKLAQTNRQKIYRIIKDHHINPVKVINKIGFYDEQVILNLLNKQDNVTDVTETNSEKTTLVTDSITVSTVLLQQVNQLKEQLKIKDKQINQLQKLLEQQQRLLDQQQQLELHEKRLVNKSNNGVTSVTAINKNKTTSVTDNVTEMDNQNNHKKWWHFW